MTIIGSKLTALAGLDGPMAGTDLLYVVRGGSQYKATLAQLRIAAAQVSDATALGRSLLTAATAVDIRTAAGLGALAVLATVGSSQIDNAAITLDKLANLATGSLLLGDGANRPAPFGTSEIGLALLAAADDMTARTILGLGALAVLDTIGTAQIDAGAVTIAEMADLAAGSLLLGDGSDRPAPFATSEIGLTLLAAADDAAVRMALGLGDLATLDTVGTAQIDAEAVTVAEMADLGENALLLGDAGNRPAAFATSALGRFLLAASAGAAVADAGDDESIAYTGIDNLQVGAVYAQLSDLNALRTAYEDMRAAFNDLLSRLRALTLIEA